MYAQTNKNNLRKEPKMLSLLIFGIIILIIGAYVRQTNKGGQGDIKARLGGRSGHPNPVPLEGA